ncbi:hypothetical protein A3848_15110 [Paenibacillus sp. P32E]|nr:hypothetical protein A3848_15110 [Paenibacillus sp. P32E]
MMLQIAQLPMSMLESISVLSVTLVTIYNVICDINSEFIVVFVKKKSKIEEKYPLVHRLFRNCSCVKITVKADILLGEKKETTGND